MKTTALVSFVLCAMSVAAGQTASIRRPPVVPWKKWVQNPPTVPFSVSIPTLCAESGTLVQITLADGLTAGYGEGCYTATNAPTLFANLSVRREYLLTVVGTNFNQIDMKVKVTPPWQLLSTKGSDSVPKAYSVLINRQLTEMTHTIAATANCDYFSNTWVVEIRDQQGARWIVDEKSNDPESAPGDGNFLEIGPAKSLLTNRITLDWSVGLGRLYDGLAAGRLRITESGLSRDAYTPKAIYYTAVSTNVRSQVDLVSANADYSVRQVKAYQCFVDITDPWTFAAADFADLPSLADRLKTETNGVSPYISNRLALVTRQALTNYQGGGSSPEPLRALLVHDFNGILAGESIYESNRFAGVTLSSETSFLNDQTSEGADLLRLNRLLLEDAYSSELANRPYQTALQFYLPGQVGANTNQDGVYTNITGSPFVSWFIQNPSPTATTNLLLIESRNGLNYTNRLVYYPRSASGSWELTTGAGSEQRIETRDVAFQFSSGTHRYETNAVRYATGSNAYKCVEHYKLFAWGWELADSRVDPEGANLTTSFEFYQDTNYVDSLGKPSTIRYPDGNWEVRLYDSNPNSHPGALQYVLRPFNGLPVDPDDATLYNCEVARHGPWFDWYGGYWAEVHHFVESESDGLLYSDAIGNTTSSSLQKEFDGRVHYNWGGHFIGTTRLRADDTWGKGRAGHLVCFADRWGPQRSMYYHGGTFSAGTFTIGQGDISAGPDWRESAVLSDGGYSGGYFEADPNHTNEDWIWVDTVEGQQLYPLYGDSVCLHIGRSTREQTVFQNGSAVQKDIAVFTGLSQGEAVFDASERFTFLNDSLGHCTNITRVDIANPTVKRTLYEANYCDTNGLDGELLRWEMDESGVRTEYSYDSLKRRTQTRRVGVTTSLATVPDLVTNVTHDAYGRTIAHTVTGGSLDLTNAWTYDLAGRLTAQIADSGLTTYRAYSNGGRVVATTLPNGVTNVQENYLEGRLKSLTGSGVIAEYHTNIVLGLEEEDVRLLDVVHLGTADSARWRATGLNKIGLQTYSCNPDFDTNGLVENQVWYKDWLHDPMQVYTTGKGSTYYKMDFDGQVSQTSLSEESLYGLGRITVSARNYVKLSGHWFRTTTNLTYLADYSATPTRTGVELERVSGFSSSGTASEVTAWDADTNATVVTTYVDRGEKKIVTVTDTPQSTLHATNITVCGLLVAESTPTVAAPTRFYYDALGRQTRVVSSLGFTASKTYNPAGQVASTTDFTGSGTGYQYYPNGVFGAGKVKAETRAKGKRTFYMYTARDELCQTWGDVPYPEERVYSDYGELVQLRTFRAGTGWSSLTWPTNTAGSYDTTTWNYQAHSGLLTNKTDAAGKAVSYSYVNGLLKSRSWARTVGGNPVTNAFAYNAFGDLISLEYSDSTPAVYYNDFNRTGLPREIVDATGTTSLFYDHASRLVLATNVDGLLGGIAVSNHFDGLHGRDLLQVLGASTSIAHEYDSDSYGRLGAVASGVYSATYGYLANSDLLHTTTCKSNTTTILTTTRSWEYGMRLGAILNEVNGVCISSHGYRYDAVNRRTRAALEDGSYWLYSYNDRDELVDARRYWYDSSPTAGQQFLYDYDNIGNRKAAQSGGDNDGLNLRSIGYAVNNLNQYTTITNLGYVDILGAAMATNAVWVNSGLAERKGEYFRKELAVGNGNGPLWTNVAVGSAGITNGGGLIVPDDRQALVYDLDGNLAFDGTWSYEWDGENRLKAMTMTNVATIPNAQRKRLEFGYDFMGRRISKVVKSWSGSAFTSPVTNLFVYDGWNLLATLNPQLSTLNSFMWGQDLSGTMDQAGGVGGLLMVTFHGSPATNCFVAYDGNGNITALADAVSGAVQARYEYSPFGDTLRVTGPLAKGNPIQFSTKFCDEESGLIYYGLRYFSASLGRWISRDPIEENGGKNLYAFTYNRTVDSFDSLGDMPLPPAVLAQLLAAITLMAADKIAGGLGNIDDELLESTTRTFEGTTCGPRPPRIGGPKPSRTLRTISPRKARVLSWMRRGPWGGMAVIVTGGIALNGVAAVAQEANNLTGTLSDFGQHLAADESAWADLDAATFAAQLQTGGSDYLFTMAMLDTLMDIQDAADYPRH